MTRISVIIPSHNCAAYLRRCIPALKAGPVAPAEILVVDDASTDDSMATAEALGARIHALSANAGPASARNAGARRAVGDVLWFVDADIEVGPDAAAQVARYFDEHPEIDAIIGSYDDEPSDPGFVSQFKNLFHHYVHQEGEERVSSFWSGCGAIRREAFDEAGGFATDLFRRPMIEDIHLGYMLRKQDRSIRILKSLQVKHHKRWTLWGLIETDIFSRAVPWTVTLLQNPHLGRGELNLRPHYRRSVYAVWLAAGCGAAGALLPWLWIAAPPLLAAPLWWNRGLLGFFRRRRGWAFMAKAALMLWLYFFYCGLGYLIGQFAYWLERATGRQLFSPKPSWRSKYQ